MWTKIIRFRRIRSVLIDENLVHMVSFSGDVLWLPDNPQPFQTDQARLWSVCLFQKSGVSTIATYPSEFRAKLEASDYAIDTAKIYHKGPSGLRPDPNSVHALDKSVLLELRHLSRIYE